MKTRNIIICLLSFFLMLTFIGIVNAEEFNGIEFPDGEASFADSVVSFVPGTYTEAPYNNSLYALGPPDYQVGDAYMHNVSLGNGGILILKFIDNSLTTSGDSDNDLSIFEIGEWNEVTHVYISSDSNNWISVGDACGSITGIDIDAYTGNGVVVGEKYTYVKLVDDYNNYYSEDGWAGADIDAVGAISSAPPLDTDNDSIPDGADNCPDIANPNQEDVDCDGIGDFCDPDTIYGTVSGEMQGDVIVGLYRPSCGVNTLLSTRITDLTGYYAFGNIGNGTYIVAPHHVSYSFVPEQKGTPIPQPEIQSYDFSAMFLLDHDGDGKINYLSGCSNLDGNCDYDDSQYDENIISVIQDDGTIEELRTYADIDFNTVTPVFHPTRDQTFDYCSNLTWSGNSDWESLDEHDAWKLASANYTFDTDCASYGSFGCDIFSNSWDPKSTWETPPEPWLSKLNLLSLYNNNWYRNWRLDGCNGREISESCTSWFTIQESDRYEQNKYETDSRHPDARPMVICKGTM